MKEHKTSKCSSCGADIIWSETLLHKKMPVNAAPYKGGNIYLVHRGDSRPPLAMHAKFKRPDEEEVPRYRAHFVTCPNASKHRKPRK